MLICPSSIQFVCFWHDSPQWARAYSFTRFLDHTQWGNTVGRTPLDEWSVRRRDLYLATHNSHKRKTSMPPVGFFFYSFIILLPAFVCIRSKIGKKKAYKNHTTSGSATHNFCLGQATHLSQSRFSICLVVNYKEKQIYLTCLYSWKPLDYSHLHLLTYLLHGAGSLLRS
jgi:hypothetical protein